MRVYSSIGVLATRLLLLLDKHIIDDSGDPEQQDQTNHVHHAFIRTPTDFGQRVLHLLVHALHVCLCGIDSLLETIDHDALLLDLFVQPTRQLTKHLHAIADLIDDLIKSLVVIFDLGHHGSMLVCDFFLLRRSALAFSTTTTAASASSTAATCAVAKLSWLGARTEERTVLELSDPRRIAAFLTERRRRWRSEVGSRELLDQCMLGNVLVDDFFPNSKFFRRKLGLFLLELGLVARLELIDVDTDETQVFSDLLLPSNGLARMLVPIDLGLGVLQVLEFESMQSLADLCLELLEAIGRVLFLLLAFLAAHLLVDLRELGHEAIEFAAHGGRLRSFRALQRPRTRASHRARNGACASPSRHM